MAKVRYEPPPPGIAFPCWIFEGVGDGRGYGQIYHQGRMRRAHVVTAEYTFGTDPPGLLRDHLCRRRACCQPFHTEAVSNRENTLRGVGPTAFNASLTHCRRGHAFDVANTYRKRNGGRSCRACAAEAARVKSLGRVSG